MAERAWGTVREDYSPDGEAWSYFPHDHARSRAFRWSEDGLGAVSDLDQYLCFGLALWNHRDPILKERVFGLSGDEGNHGEDAKEYWWYLDATPTHSWMRWRYLYPHVEFPYAQLVHENAARDRSDPEFELIDTGVLDEGRYWRITVDYAKADPDDLCIAIEVHNSGPDRAEIDVLPTLWFRNTWSWGLDDRRPTLSAGADGSSIDAVHWSLGAYRLDTEPGPDGPGELLFCDNETNYQRVFGVQGPSPYPKDGIGDHVISGAATVNPTSTGTKAAVLHRLVVDGGGTVTLRLRLRSHDPAAGGSSLRSTAEEPFGPDFDAVMRDRRDEADRFYAAVIGPQVPPDEALVARQAFAGLLWSTQFFHLDVERWIDGDPAGPPPPPERRGGRNAHWRHLNNRDVISMPDTWEYPWYAAWDLAFHSVTLARIDPEFAKHQLTLMCREWYMHPNGQLPAYEWAFDDVNPPVHAWAALRVFELDGSTDHEFLEAIFHKLLINFTWWVNRKDAEGNNVFEGGFLGLDNIGPFDRSKGLPEGGTLEQSDGTAWMAMYCLDMLQIALVLADHDDSYEDVATKFFEHFAYIATAMNAQGLWDEGLGFYRDLFRKDGGENIGIPVISMVGLVPLFAVAVLEEGSVERHRDFAARANWFVAHKPAFAAVLDPGSIAGTTDRRLSIVDPERLRVILRSALDQDRLLSPHGLRSLSRHHRDYPVVVTIGGVEHRVDYEPAESRTFTFGGNSNWRGPVWFPLNVLAIESLRRHHRHLGDAYLIEYPTGSGQHLTLAQIADDLADRLIGLLRAGPDGGRPSQPVPSALLRDSTWRSQVLFHEYFDGDDGRGLGASHQTGWTAQVADLIIERHLRHPT